MLKVRRLALGPMSNFVYLLGDVETGDAAVVDPAWDIPAVLEAVRGEGWTLRQALVTHKHSDHTNGLEALLRAADLPVRVHEADAHALSAFQGALKPTRGGDRLALGKSELEVLHTPGHTHGSQCFLAQGKVVTGDTLFVGTCGRVDLPDSDPAKMQASLKRLSELPAATVLLPGHDYGATPEASVGDEREANRFLAASREGLDAFLAAVGRD